jgi:hypothetical protein
VRGYTGGSGAYLLSSLDKILKSVGAVNVAPAPSMTLADLPLIGGFVQRFPTSNAQSIEDFYKKYQENKRIWEDKKVTSGIRDISRDMRIEGKASSMKPLEKMMVGMPPDLIMQTEVAQVLTLLRKETSFIRDNIQLTPDQKRNALDSIYIQMTNISRLALGKQLLKQGAK